MRPQVSFLRMCYLIVEPSRKAQDLSCLSLAHKLCVTAHKDLAKNRLPSTVLPHCFLSVGPNYKSNFYLPLIYLSLPWASCSGWFLSSYHQSSNSS